MSREYEERTAPRKERISAEERKDSIIYRRAKIRMTEDSCIILGLFLLTHVKTDTVKA